MSMESVNNEIIPESEFLDEMKSSARIIFEKNDNLDKAYFKADLGFGCYFYIRKFNNKIEGFCLHTNRDNSVVNHFINGYQEIVDFKN
jgi:hypothetical protein